MQNNLLEPGLECCRWSGARKVLKTFLSFKLQNKLFLKTSETWYFFYLGCLFWEEGVHFASYGSNTARLTAEFGDSTLLGVRCISDIEQEGWLRTRCISSDFQGWHESDIWEDGCQTLSWSDADQFCRNLGPNIRLPTLEEIEDNCVTGGGCLLNNNFIWSSTAPVKFTIQILVHFSN